MEGASGTAAIVREAEAFMEFLLAVIVTSGKPGATDDSYHGPARPSGR